MKGKVAEGGSVGKGFAWLYFRKGVELSFGLRSKRSAIILVCIVLGCANALILLYCIICRFTTGFFIPKIMSDCFVDCPVVPGAKVEILLYIKEEF